MSYFGFLRVSSSKQNNEKFLQEMSSFAKKENFSYRKIYQEVKSGKIYWRNRSIGHCLEKCKSGDFIVTPELSRLGRSMLDIMEIAGEALRNNITIVSLKNNFIIKNDLTSKILLSSFGIAAEIERELLVSRINEALASVRAKGIVLGHPVGKMGKIHNKHFESAKKLYAEGVSIPDISKQLRINYQRAYYLVRKIKAL